MVNTSRENRIELRQKWTLVMGAAVSSKVCCLINLLIKVLDNVGVTQLVQRIDFAD